MSLVDPKALYDGIQVNTGGMDAGNAPNVISNGKCAFARNVTFRGGFPQSRPGWKKIPLVFDNEDVQSVFQSGLFQRATPFKPYFGGSKIVISIGGKLYKINVDQQYKTDLLTGATLNPIFERVWFTQGEDFIIAQDGQSAALVYDNVNLRQTNPSSNPKEIPVGTVMTYALGRLGVALPGAKSFSFGNIVYGDDGSSKYGDRDAILKWSENTFLNGGGAFGVPFDAGTIQAMHPLAVLDTSLGQGPIQIFTTGGGFGIDLPFDRASWLQVTYPLKTTSLIGSGFVSQEAVINVNGDLWGRSTDGIRSFQIARRDFNSWVNTPLSSEMTPILDTDDKTLLPFASAINFDNRGLFTASPFRVQDHGVCWRGLIALDFHNVSGIGIRTAPVYDGLWTGLNILQVVELDKRCFIFVLSPTNKIELWELTTNEAFDNGSVRIQSFIDTPSFNFGDNLIRKELSTGILRYDQLVGTVDMSVQFRPDQYPCFMPWHTWSVDSKNESCFTTEVCPIPQNLQPQYRPWTRLPLPSDSCNSRVNMPFRNGHEFQMRIAWTGHARLLRFVGVAHDVQQDVLPYCEPTEPTDTEGLDCCITSLYNFSSE